MKIDFVNTVDVGTIASGAAIFDDLPVHYRIEWRLRQKPFLGMKQPTPQGGFLGSECIFILEVDGARAKHYRFQLFCDDEEQSGGFTNEHGESGDLHIKMPYQGRHVYSIEVLGPVEKDEPTTEEPEHVYANPDPNS